MTDYSLEYDALDEHQLSRAVETWIQSAQTPSITYDDAAAAFNLAIPRTIFFKNCADRTSILDLGAGDGTLSVYKEWPLYRRDDLKLYALSLSKGSMFDRYDGFEIKDFESTDGVFQGVPFGGIVCAHFIEHMKEPRRTIDFIGRRLSSGGRLYLEWPHPISKRMPSRNNFSSRGINISTIRFDDDFTHVEAWSMESIVPMLADAGMRVELAGRIHLPWIAGQLRNHAAQTNDGTWMTLGVWAAFGWAQFLIASKI